MNEGLAFALLGFIYVDHEDLLQRLVERQILVGITRQSQHRSTMVGDDRHEEIGLARKQSIKGLLRNPTTGGDQIHRRPAVTELVECRTRLRDDLGSALIVAYGFRTAARAAYRSLIGYTPPFLRPRFHLHLNNRMRLTFGAIHIFSVRPRTVNKATGNSNVRKLASFTSGSMYPAVSTHLLTTRTAMMVAGVAAAMLLAGCNDQKAAQNNAPVVRTEVSAMALHPQSVAITAELPGRTSAYLVAEVRPQVGGIIRSRNFKEGSEVKAGDVLYEIDPASYQASYDSAVAALQKAEGAVPSAQSKVDRYKSLTAQDAVSKQNLDDAVSTLAQANADVASAKAALETARINLDYTKMRAPIAGRVDASAVTVGALVTADQTTALTTIRQLDPINVDVTQSSTNLLEFRRAIADGRLKTSGDNVSVHLTLEDRSQYKEAGKLEFAEAAVAETVGTITVRAVFPNPDRILLPGMYVRATIQEGIAENSFLVPQRAVFRNTKGEPTAMFVAADNKVQQRVLKVQRSIGNSWLVNEGMKDGDRVIVEGSQRVRDGQEVTVSPVTIDDATGEVKQAAADAKPLEQQAELEKTDIKAASGAQK